MELTKKLQTIEENIGLEATYASGSYTVTVWDNMDGEYKMIFTRRGTDIPHSRETVSPANLESEMRKYQSDLRRWRKVDYDQQ
jgi:hypothetical protein